MNRRCKKGHSDIASREHDGNWIGENCFYRSSDKSPIEVIDSCCEKEKKLYLEDNGPPSMDYGHYSQIVWKATQEIGCGRAKDKNGRWYWVCHYFPGGNSPEWPKNLIPRENLK